MRLVKLKLSGDTDSVVHINPEHVVSVCTGNRGTILEMVNSGPDDPGWNLADSQYLVAELLAVEGE